MKRRIVYRSALILATCVGLSAPLRAQAGLPDGPGRIEFEKICGTCHGLDRATALKLSEAAWKEKVDTMVQYGASGTMEDLASVTAYLAKNFGPPAGDQPQALAPAAAPAVGTAPAKTLPEGKGKDLIDKLCVGCHKPDNFTTYQHTPEEWAAILVRMGERVRVPNTKADLDEIAGTSPKIFRKSTIPTRST